MFRESIDPSYITKSGHKTPWIGYFWSGVAGSMNIVADAFFSKETFVTPMLNAGFTVISRLRNDSVLFYPTTKERTGKRGRPFVYDGKIDFNNLDPDSKSSSSFVQGSNILD